MARPAPAEIPEIYAQQPQQGFDTFGDLRVLRDIQPDFSGMDFIDPSGIDIGAIDIPDAVTLLSEEDQAAIAEGKKFLSAEKKFAEAVAYLKAYNQGLAIDSERFTDDSGKFTDESLEAFFEGQRDAQDALQVARANYEAVGGKPETLMNKILGGVTTVGAAPSAGAAAAGIPSFNQVLYNIPSILTGQPVVTGSYSDAGTNTPLKVGEKDKTIIAATTGSQAADEALAGIFGGEAIITETGDINVPSREDVTGAIGGIFRDPASGTLVNTVATTDTGTADEDAVVGVDTTKVALPGGADAVENVLGGFTDDPKIKDPNGDSNSSGDSAVLDQLPSVDRVSLPGAEVPVDRVSLPGAEVPVDRVSLPGAEVPVDRVSLPEAVIEEILANERTDPTRTSLPEPTKTSVAAAGGGGGGGGGTTAPSGGIRTVSGGPGPSVDIDYLYDFARGLEQPFQATEEEEEDIVRAAEGGMIGNTDDFERILRILRGM